VRLLRPLPRRVTETIAFLVLAAWVSTMAVLVSRAAPANLATDLARYGSTAEWRGVYYRGEKLGFTVAQTIPRDDGFELQEDGRLQMSLLGASTAARIRTTVRVDDSFGLRSFEFSLDPGTGATEVRGRMDGNRLMLSIVSGGATRVEERPLDETPVLSLNLGKRLARDGLKPGAERRFLLFDPATLRNKPVVVKVGKRELVRGGAGRIPAFPVEMNFDGLRTTSWVTDTGDVVREESPMGLIVVRETPEQARRMAVADPGTRTDVLESAAVVPVMTGRIDQPRDVRRLRLRLDGADLSSADVQGAGQSAAGDVIEIRDPQTLAAGPADPDTARYLQPEALIESDAPEVRAEAEKAVANVVTTRARAERLTRYVNALIEKKPTVSLPSARDVLRTRVGDCNEHTALYVAMARSLGIPSRVAVGLVYVHGAFYYHAWPEVYLDEGRALGLWLPVDPTLNQYPADGTHVRLARGGLDRQAAILPLIGRLKMTVLDLELSPNATPVLVGRQPTDLSPLAIDVPRKRSGDCWSAEPPRRRVRQIPKAPRR
jgi:transglutaminase-like putative cysteine protease